MKRLLILTIILCSTWNIFGQLPVRTKTDRFWINDTAFLTWIKNSPLFSANLPIGDIAEKYPNQKTIVETTGNFYADSLTGSLVLPYKATYLILVYGQIIADPINPVTCSATSVSYALFTSENTVTPIANNQTSIPALTAETVYSQNISFFGTVTTTSTNRRVTISLFLDVLPALGNVKSNGFHIAYIKL